MKKTILNKIFALLIFILNLYFIPLTIINIVTTSKAAGFSLLGIAFTFVINLLLVTSVLALRKKHSNSLTLLIINFIGAMMGIALLILLISSPLMD